MLAIQAVEVYSTGCIFDVTWMLRRVEQEDRKWADVNAVFHCTAPQVRDGGIAAASMLLFGLRSMDGTKASRSFLWVPC